MNLLVSWLVLSVAVYLTAAILPGFHVKSFGGAFLVSALFGVLNFFLGWLFFVLFASAGGFRPSFEGVRREHGERPVIAWALDMLFPDDEPPAAPGARVP